MNLQQAQTMANLQIPLPVEKPLKKKSALQVAKRVCDLAASIHEHMVYKRLKNGKSKRHTPESWAHRWLASDDFILMQVDINAAAAPNPPKNPQRVKHYMRAAASPEANEPVVIDINKRGVGKSHHGYIPEVVFLDGKHRRDAKLKLGARTIMAWVGTKALKKIKPERIQPNDVEVTKYVGPTRMDAAYEIYATTTPSVGLANTVNRQDSGEGGSRPVDRMHSKRKVKAGDTGDCNACGARSSGSLDEPDDSETDAIGSTQGKPNASDSNKTFSDASDQRKWQPNKPQNHAPGTGPGYVKRFSVDPAQAAPGAGSGPRVPNKGASKSEYARQLNASRPFPNLKSKGKMVPDIHEDMDAEAPPGREAQVKTLKRKFGKKSGIPFAIAWDQHDKAKRRSE